MKKDRIVRHKRLRAKIMGTESRPRLSVFRSSKHVEIQVVDDVSRKTLFGKKDFKVKKGTKTEKAISFAEAAAKEILAKGIKKVVFDRGGYQYHGRIKALAEALRKEGLEF